MNSRKIYPLLCEMIAVLILSCCMPSSLIFADECQEEVAGQIRLEPHHPWRPPFGLDRIGQGFTAVVEVQAKARPLREYWLSAQSRGTETQRKIVALAGIFAKPPYVGKVVFNQPFDELILFAKCRFDGNAVEITRQKIQLPELEAEAVAHADELTNPVDLGAILVPYDWLLLGPGQKAHMEVAAISYAADPRHAQATAWFESNTQSKMQKELNLEPGKRQQAVFQLTAPSSIEKDVLHVAITGGNGKELWHKKIPTMRVLQPPKLPEFGATELKLRYDAPISVRNPQTGEFSSIGYDSAWSPELKDVVVSLPNGSRYVFWRGSSYIPFWAGKQNTGLSYEWAETLPPADGFVDCVEPLMDKELRYSRVEIVESTPARVHVRWTYQSTDFMYKVWGDMPVEDYYFYPDGFGTRILSLKNTPGASYEVQEFIVIAPQSGFPFEVMNPKTTDILFLDGQKREILFPSKGEQSETGSIKRAGVGDAREIPAIYRIRFQKDDARAAISFSPYNTLLPAIFGPFYDRGEMVTPFYWGSHWPLARGNMTGMAIDDRIYLSPSHNSVMTWGMNNHTPAFTTTLQTHDTMGRAKTMTYRRWYWLIGLTDASDSRLLEWAHSFATPPSLALDGARLDLDSYVPERRAMRLIVDKPSVAITMKPSARCVNPVFELLRAPKTLTSIAVDGRSLKPKEYAWDGQTLWLDLDVETDTKLSLEFRQ